MNYRTKENLYPFAEILATAVSGFILRNFNDEECEDQKKFDLHLKPVYQFVKDPSNFWKYYKTLYFMRALNKNEFRLIESTANKHPESMIDGLIQDSLVEAAELALKGYKEIHDYEIKRKSFNLPERFLAQYPVEEKEPCPKPKIPKEIKEHLQNK